MRLCAIITLLYYFCSLPREYNARLQPPPTINENTRERKLGQCQACKVFIDSFKQGMQNTARGKYEGGDAAWEEEKLRSYAKSELRLIEIQEGFCQSENFKEQCQMIGEESEDLIEEWWFSEEPRVDIFEWICIKKLEHCCPKNHYGKHCLPCFGSPDNVCSNNGKCKGEGTRKGNGHCLCDTGYVGLDCNQCNETFYESYRDEKKLLCSPCHISCKDSCSQGGTKGCRICKEGWTMDSEVGCLDINECLKDLPCIKNEFCVNVEGSYSCLKCDKTCDGCSGDGPDMCDKCAKGYDLSDGLCVDTEIGRRYYRAVFTRYLTYFGLCVATSITLQKSTYLAAFVGTLVAVYVAISEYTLQMLPDMQQTI